MKTVEFRVEIECDHTMDAIQNRQHQIELLFQALGIEIQSSTQRPVGLRDDDPLMIKLTE